MAGPSLTFRAGGARFAVPAASVREVARVPRLTRVPHAPPSLIGLGNFRGTVLPVLSLAALLARPRGDEAHVLLVEDGERVGIAVDVVEGIARAADAAEPVALASLIAAGFARVERRAGRAIVAGARTAGRRDEIPLLVFAVGAQDFALPVGAVEAVLRLPRDVTVLPQADAAVVGSMSVRNRLLPLLSLAALLGLGATAAGARTPVIVVRIGAHRFGLVVDAMRAIERVPESDLDAVPAVFNRGGAEARIQAIGRLDGGRRLVSVLAVEHLLSDTLTARLLRSSGEMPDAAPATDAPAERFLAFRVGDGAFGLPVAAIDEVAPVPDRLTRLPNAPAFVQGVMNLRGAVVPVVDQVRRFDGVAARGAKRRIIVVRAGATRIGFIVDAAPEVLRVPASALCEAPELGGAETRVFERVAALGDDARIVLILSPRELLDGAERDMLAALRPEGAVAQS
ncbi:chemotaxis protein CheW [Sphingomonas sp. NFR15]|uniref:chemotaxis protein CheW n=1 Tax=Sphingomonas sp. NFR15 TaxID=1566282 RepID=UPI00088853FA|nr:chemotaxis protein CheW [Sphingomonas sp. NFR15]SDA31693.1 purine-binding chemotaxis protein CheW [Sphingomonas sp. NFR15]